MKLNKKGFTLLEIIIVIIIIGVLASLALPRFFDVIEAARAGEALQNISAIRGSINRCYLRRNAYTNCDSFANLDIADPQTAVGNHFTYNLLTGANTYMIIAYRNALANSGSTGDVVQLSADGSNIVKSGSGKFGDIN